MLSFLGSPPPLHSSPLLAAPRRSSPSLPARTRAHSNRDHVTTRIADHPARTRSLACRGLRSATRSAHPGRSLRPLAATCARSCTAKTRQLTSRVQDGWSRFDGEGLPGPSRTAWAGAPPRSTRSTCASALTCAAPAALPARARGPRTSRCARSRWTIPSAALAASPCAPRTPSPTRARSTATASNAGWRCTMMAWSRPPS